MRKKGRTDYKKAFGEALDAQLHARQMTQSDLAAKTGKTVSYVNKTMHGSRFVSPEWANVVAKALALSGPDTKQLHTAAALDAGYKLDLRKP